MSNLQKYNPYREFRQGQEHAITSMLKLWENGQKVIELNAPTASGKSVDLYVLGKILEKEYNLAKVVYTSPQVALIESGNLFDLPKLVGKRNYPCLGLVDCTAEECPFTSKEEGFAVCEDCSYRAAKKAFKESDFGAATFHRYLADPSIYSECSVLFVDESSELEGILLDKATIELNINLKDITKKSKIYDKSNDLQKFLETFDVKPHLENQYDKLQQIVKDLGKQCTDYRSQIFKNKPTSSEIKRLKAIQHEYNKHYRQETACANALRYIKAGVPYVLTSDIEEVWNAGMRRKELLPVPYFKLLDSHVVFGDLVAKLDCVVLASGTPTTSMVTSQYKSVMIPHPIDVSRRLIHYDPVGSMNYNSRERTAKQMAIRIKQLHDTYSRHTLVHTGSYAVARIIMEYLCRLHDDIVIQEQGYREKALADWQAKDDTIFLSVNYERGISLDGPEYPMNIIAKIPFPALYDYWIQAKNLLDNKYYYNLTTAVAIQQAAGRCTRSPEDRSDTHILDSSFYYFYQKHKYLFCDWFKEALII